MLDLFAQPDRLVALILLLPLAGWSAWSQRRRLRVWQALGQTGRPGPSGAGWRWLAVGLILVALAQPRWGRWVTPWGLPGRDLVLVVDVSRSMAAEDAVPDRLAVAVESASSLVRAAEGTPGDRFAVVAFAGRAVVRCPLTFQAGAALETLRRLRVGEVEPGGTDLGRAIDVALGVFDNEVHAKGRALFVFSDGEDFAGSVATAAARARSLGVVVHTVAIGDPDQGHPIPSGRNNPPNLTYQGTPVATRRTDPPLDALRLATGGTLIRLGLAPRDLHPVFETTIQAVTTTAREVRHPSPRVERASWFALAALVAIVLGSWRGRAEGRSRVRFRRASWVGGLVSLGLSLGAGDPTDPAGDRIARGEARYAAGQFADALVEFQKAAELAPSAAVPLYNAAAASYRLGRFRESAIFYERAADHAGPNLRARSHFGLGNAWVAAGDLDAAITAYDHCIAATSTDPATQRVQADAKVNRAFVLRHRGLPLPPDQELSEPKPGRSRDPGSGGRAGPSDPSKSHETNPPQPTPGSAAETSTPGSGARGTGGQGGEGKAPPGQGTPEARLNEALRAVRASRELRPAETSPPLGQSSNGRDW